MMSELRSTADGTATLFSTAFNQTYHSVHGALTEAEHVYVHLSRVRPVLVARGEVSVLEVGFGTGLNLIATLRSCANAAGTLNYVSMEPFPVAGPVIDEMGYAGLLSGAAAGWYTSFMRSLADAADGELVCAAVRLGDLQVDLRVWRGVWSSMPEALTGFDAVYQDAFSPDSCPELWTPTFFGAVRGRLRDGVGTLSTYSCAGAVRRSLTESGWRVERVQGPPGGKREVLQAICNIQGVAMPGENEGVGVPTRPVRT